MYYGQRTLGALDMPTAQHDSTGNARLGVLNQSLFFLFLFVFFLFLIQYLIECTNTSQRLDTISFNVLDLMFFFWFTLYTPPAFVRILWTKKRVIT